MSLEIVSRTDDEIVIERRTPLSDLMRVASDLFERRMWPQSEVLYRYILQKEPRNALALNNLSIIRASSDDLDEAVQLSQRAIAAAPGVANFQANLATSYMDMGRFAEAAATYRKALELEPEYEYANSSLGILLLRTGQFDEAWPHYRKRRKPKRDAGLIGQYRSWAGEPLRGKSLLILDELGLGEAFQVARLFGPILAQCKELTLVCDPRIVELLRRSFPSLNTIENGASEKILQLAKTVDYVSYLADLTGYLSPGARPDVTPMAYLKPDPTKVEALRQKYRRQYGDRHLVGFAWSTASKYKPAARTIPVEQWKRLLKRPDCQFFSLQYSSDTAGLRKAASELGVSIAIDEDIDARNDIDGLAAQICALDQVISIDNTTVHLAGALGQPVWTLLMKYPHWLWGLEGDRSNWYASMRLFRQADNGNWDQVLTDVEAALDGELKQSGISASSRGKQRLSA